MAVAERAEFADLLDALTDEQWQAMSLCGDWCVKDVAAHVTAYLDRGYAAFGVGLLRHGLSVGRLNARDVSTHSVYSLREVAGRMRSGMIPGGVGAGFGGRVALVECMIHQQDIRRPLALPRTIPAERLRVALNFARASPVIRGAWTTRGVRLIASDLDWAGGRGALVTGSGEALLMAMAGRSSALADLTGPGVAILAARGRAN